MQCALVDANGYMQLAPVDHVGACAAYVMTPDEVAFLSTLTLDPAQMSLAFSWGFGAVALFGLGAPYAAKLARSVLRMM